MLKASLGFMFSHGFVRVRRGTGRLTGHLPFSTTSSGNGINQQRGSATTALDDSLLVRSGYGQFAVTHDFAVRCQESACETRLDSRIKMGHSKILSTTRVSFANFAAHLGGNGLGDFDDRGAFPQI